MKKLVILLNLILCFELILMPMEQSLFSVNKTYAQSCANGMEWDARLGRCLTKTDTAKVLQATAKCDPQDVACYKQNAKQAFGKEVAKDDNLKKDKGASDVLKVAGQGSGIVAAFYAGSAWMNTTGKANPCTSASYGLIIAAAATTVIGDLVADQKHKSKLKKIEKDWDKIVKTNYDGTDKDSKRAHSSEAQSEAFEMLARAEDSAHDNATTKKKIYSAAALMYSISAIAAGAEMIQAGGGGKCAASFSEPSVESKYAHTQYELFPSLASSDESFKDFLSFNRKRQYLQSNALKDDLESIYTVFTTPIEDHISPSIDEYFQNSTLFAFDQESKNSVKEALITFLHNINPIPVAHASAPIMSTAGFRLATSLMFAGWSLIMFNEASDQAKASNNRATFLRKMKEDFKGSAAAINMCKPEDRTDTSKPYCYCYTPEGHRNPGRSNSQICQKLWGAELASAKGYKDSSNAFSGCINNQNQYDAGCACKKSSKGCLKVSVNGLNGVPTGTFSLMNSGISPINDIASGNFDRATANDEALVNSAMRNLKAAEKMLESPQFAKEKENIKKGMRLAENEFKKMGSSQSHTPLASNFSGDLGKIASDLEKELDKVIPPKGKTESKKTAVAAGEKKKSPAFNFDFGTEEQQTINEQVSDVMKQQFDYAQNDIHQSQTNLFELLSNRYQRSGMRRLFDDERVMQPDAPSTTDINN